MSKGALEHILAETRPILTRFSTKQADEIETQDNIKMMVNIY